MSLSVESKCDSLCGILKSLGKVAVAFSGGADSAFLLGFASHVLGVGNCLAVTVRMNGSVSSDAEFAEDFCRRRGIEKIDIPFDELEEVACFRENPPDRCYHCKKKLLEKIESAAAARGFANVCEGTNTDDYSDFRPGLRALENSKVISPLAQAGFSKSDIKAAALKHSLDEICTLQPSACLSSRIPCGQEITYEKLAAVSAAEGFLRDAGLSCVRVRHHGDIARIETDDAGFSIVCSIRGKVLKSFAALGFRYACVDLAGYVRGSMNFTEGGRP